MSAPLKAIYKRHVIQRTDKYGYPTGQFYWSCWEKFESQKFLKKGVDMEERLTFWRGLNDYAVSFRGREAKVEYKLEDEQ